MEFNSGFKGLICALVDLTMSNLAHTARCQRPTPVVSMKTSFITLFFVLGWRFACVRLLPFTVYYIMNTSCFPWLHGSVKQILFPFVGCSQGFWLKNFWRKPFLPYIKATGMDVYREIYDGCLQTSRNWGQQSLFLINKCIKNVRLKDARTINFIK